MFSSSVFFKICSCSSIRPSLCDLHFRLPSASRLIQETITDSRETDDQVGFENENYERMMSMRKMKELQKLDGGTPTITWADPKSTPDHFAAQINSIDKVMFRIHGNCTSKCKWVILDSPEASKLLSAVAIAFLNCSSLWPTFVPVHDPSRKAYIGIQKWGHFLLEDLRRILFLVKFQ
ncbi:hypothetical protein L1887_11296 [Cichorium endivia]|nr:hypothetical protein L1887_11296 [Cichorium endivia]